MKAGPIFDTNDISRALRRESTMERCCNQAKERRALELQFVDPCGGTVPSHVAMIRVCKPIEFPESGVSAPCWREQDTSGRHERSSTEPENWIVCTGNHSSVRLEELPGPQGRVSNPVNAPKAPRRRHQRRSVYRQPAEADTPPGSYQWRWRHRSEPVHRPASRGLPGDRRRSRWPRRSSSHESCRPRMPSVGTPSRRYSLDVFAHAMVLMPQSVAPQFM